MPLDTTTASVCPTCSCFPCICSDPPPPPIDLKINPYLNSHAKAWIAALRSGKYEQTAYSLRFKDSFCVWGVACDISQLGEWKDDCFCIEDNRHSSRPPDIVIDRVAVEPFCVDKLMIMNDNGETFTELADYMEENFSLVFIQKKGTGRFSQG